MALTFLQPLAFLGLLGVAVPILIHLMERRKEVTLLLPTVRFILEAHRRTSRRLKIRRWLLLVTRILMVLFLTLILSRPSLTRKEALVHSAKPTSAVIILDNSPSMEVVQGGSTRWAEARTLAGEFADAVLTAGEVALVTAGGGDAGRSQGFTRASSRLKAALDATAVSANPADWSRSLNAAYRFMERAAHPTRQIVIFSDMRRPEWSNFKPQSLVKPDLGIPVRLVDASLGEQGWNRAVTGVAAEVPPMGGGAGVVRVTLEGHGEIPAGPTTVQVDLDGRILSRRVVESLGGEPREFEFPLPRMESGTHQLSAAVDSDPLAFDNKYYAALRFGGLVRVLTVDGSPRGSLLESETFFIRTALVPDRLTENQTVENTVILPGQLASVRLDAYQVVILANVRSLEPSVARALAARVEEGGGLLITLGDNYQASVFQASYDGAGADLLPEYLGEAAEPPDQGVLHRIDYEAYPLEIFRKTGSGDFSRASFTRYVQPGPGALKPGAVTLLAFDREGLKPLLVERVRGKGRIMLMTSSADLDWNNLPAQTVYLPLLQRSVAHLAGGQGLSMIPGAVAGSEVGIDLGASFAGSSVPVTTPDGAGRQAVVERAGGSARAVLPEAEKAGWYLFHSGETEIPAPVNVTREESDVRRVSPETLEALRKVIPLEEVKVDAGGLSRERLSGSVDPTPWIFALLLCLLVVEGVVSVGLRRAPGNDGASTFVTGA